MSDRTHDLIDDKRQRVNQKLLTKLCLIVVVMFGFGYALVPFYEKICEATGLRNIAAPSQLG